jgi:uncharacterized protein YbjT (DUF2867 family)
MPVTETGFDVVTGAYSYTGRYIAKRLTAVGRRVRTLTRSRPGQADPRIEAVPYSFDDFDRLVDHLRGAETLYNTYWARFERDEMTFEQAIRNSTKLFEAARKADVERIVHVSITNPSPASTLPYFRGKALVEKALVEVGLPFVIVRPTVVFGKEDVLINNIAFLLRRLPVFGIAGDGRYRLRPVHVDDVARLCVEGAQDADNAVVEAVGPETLSFKEMVEHIRDAVGSPARLIHLPPSLVALCAKVVGWGLKDVLLTADELAGVMTELVTSDSPTTGKIFFSEWISKNGEELGREYVSELERNFTGVSA